MTRADKIEAVGRLLARLAQPTPHGSRVVHLDDVADYDLETLGVSRRGLMAFIRINQAAWGGVYAASVFRKGDPRQFNAEARKSRWTPARYIFPRGTDPEEAP